MRASAPLLGIILKHNQPQCRRRDGREGEGRREGGNQLPERVKKRPAWIEGVGGYDTSDFNEAAILNNNNDVARTGTTCTIVLMEVR